YAIDSDGRSVFDHLFSYLQHHPSAEKAVPFFRLLLRHGATPFWNRDLFSHRSMLWSESIADLPLTLRPVRLSACIDETERRLQLRSRAQILPLLTATALPAPGSAPSSAIERASGSSLFEPRLLPVIHEFLTPPPEETRRLEWARQHLHASHTAD